MKTATHHRSTRQLSRRDFISVAALGVGAMHSLLSAKETAPSARLSGAAVPFSHEKATTYATINRESWADILADNQNAYVTPVTVHLPIQPVHSPDFIHVDSGLTVCRRRVYPNLSFSSDVRKAALAHETFLIQFALDTPPFVPDFHASRLALVEGKYPLAQAGYFAGNLLYEFEYFCRRLDERQNILWIGVSVTNEGDRPRRAHVHAKVNFQIESRIFNPHYEPFYWDATKWLPCDSVRIEDHAICRDESPIGRVMPGGWTLEWESGKAFDEQAFAKAPHRVAPCMRLNHVQDALYFSVRLAPAEQRRFWIALLVTLGLLIALYVGLHLAFPAKATIGLWDQDPQRFFEVLMWGLAGVLVYKIITVGWYLRNQRFYREGIVMHIGHIITTPLLVLVACCSCPWRL